MSINLAYSLRSLWGNLNDPRSWSSFLGGSTTASGATVSPESAQMVSAYFASGQALGNDTAGLPLGVFQKTESGRVARQDHPMFNLLNHQAGRFMSATNFRASWMMAAPNWGGGYAYILRDAAGRPLGIQSIASSWVVGERMVDGERFYVINRPGLTEPVVIPDRDTLHLYGVGPTGYGGYSLAGLAAETLGLSIQAEKFGSKFFANSAVPSFIIKFPPKWMPGEDRVNKAIEEWQIMAGGVDSLNFRGVRPIFDGMDATPYFIPNNDSQFLETRQHQVEEIARWFRMPLHMIGHLLRSTNNNIEHQGLEYVTYTLWSWTKRIQDELWMKSLTEAEQEAGFYFEHNFAALLRGDLAAQANYFRTMQNQGNLTINEVRALNNLNGIGPEGDTIMVPVFIQPLEAAIKKAEAEAMKAEVSAEQAEASVPQVPPSQGGDNTRDNPKSGVLAPALRPVLEAALRESSTRAMKATAQALKKFADDPGGFNLWRKDFFAGHADYASGKMMPAAKALAGLLGKEASPIMDKFKTFARDRVEAQALAANQPGAPEQWAETVPVEVTEILELIGVSDE